MLTQRFDRNRFLSLLDQWDAHRVYFAQDMAKDLQDCGLDARSLNGEEGLEVQGIRVSLTTPEWGTPGVHPLSLVAAIWELEFGDWPESKMTGIGFRYQDVVSKLHQRWKEHRLIG